MQFEEALAHIRDNVESVFNVYTDKDGHYILKFYNFKDKEPVMSWQEKGSSFETVGSFVSIIFILKSEWELIS